MESRGADGRGNADFRDDSSADNGYSLRLHDRASDTDWEVTMYFFDDAQSATEAMEAYFVSFPTYSLHRKGRVFVAWDTIPETSWDAVPVTVDGLGDIPEPPRMLRRDIVDPCLSHQ